MFLQGPHFNKIVIITKVLIMVLTYTKYMTTPTSILRQTGQHSPGGVYDSIQNGVTHCSAEQSEKHGTIENI